MIQHILFPTDFSETADVAMTYAGALADAFGATLHLIHVLENTNPAGGWTAGTHYVPPPSELIEGMEHEAEKELKTAFAKLRPQPPKFVLAVRAGSPLVEIVRYAKEQHIDVIVMGTHGHGPVAHLLLGSVAENVVRRAPCPVLTVRHPSHKFVHP